MKMLSPNNLPTLNTKRRPTVGDMRRQWKRLHGKPYYQQRMRIWQESPRCTACGVLVPYESYEMDHITPVHLGGSVGDENCQVLCRECHRAKSNEELTNLSKSKDLHGAG